MRIYIVSDIHYASPAEQARRDHEFKGISNPITRSLLRAYRDYLWLKNPTNQNHLLDHFLEQTGDADFVVANGDYSCNTGFIGVADEAACQSADICLSRLRQQFGSRFQAVFGDHELGKLSLAGNQGGLRLGSWHRAIGPLKLEPFWKVEFGNYVLMGVVSTLLALPVFEPETLASEMPEWRALREIQLQKIRQTFEHLKPKQKVVLFCHDPTALPFLWREPAVRAGIAQVEQTIIGHLHSPLILWKSHFLAGIPRITFLGNSVRRFSTALHEARHWQEFRVRLCPSLAGIELLKDGGYLAMDLDPEGKAPLRIEQKRIVR
ncbi:MAG: metallophosphoesterase [Verrucomicrobia bacterium]|nr:metallophosphoesterase [Verrucomicrobiota bacterium]